jgi:hypothetical protein
MLAMPLLRRLQLWQGVEHDVTLAMWHMVVDVKSSNLKR